MSPLREDYTRWVKEFITKSVGVEELKLRFEKFSPNQQRTIIKLLGESVAGFRK